MAITVDQASISSGVATSPSNPWNVNTTVTAASNTYLTLGVTWFGATTITGVTFGGAAGTILIQGKNGSRSACLVGFLATSGLSSGATIAVTGSGSLVDASRGCMSWLGVDTTTPVSATTGPTSNASTAWASASSTLAAGGALVASAFQEGFTTTNNTPAAGVSESYDLTSDGNGSVLVYRIEAAGGSFTVGGTWTAGTSNGVNVAAVLAPAAGAAAYPFELLTPTPRYY